MSYSEQDGQVVLTMSREDYEWLLLMLGALTGYSMHGESMFSLSGLLAFVNRLNSGNPNFTPYQVEKKKP